MRRAKDATESVREAGQTNRRLAILFRRSARFDESRSARWLALDGRITRNDANGNARVAWIFAGEAAVPFIAGRLDQPLKTVVQGALEADGELHVGQVDFYEAVIFHAGPMKSRICAAAGRTAGLIPKLVPRPREVTHVSEPAGQINKPTQLFRVSLAHINTTLAKNATSPGVLNNLAGRAIIVSGIIDRGERVNSGRKMQGPHLGLTQQFNSP
jgi:hypothetical protein